MTLLEKYHKETTWHGKATVMEIFHLAMSHKDSKWTISKTASHFECSIGLVSENLRLARALHVYRNLINCKSRQDALNRLNGRRVNNG